MLLSRISELGGRLAQLGLGLDQLEKVWHAVEHYQLTWEREISLLAVGIRQTEGSLACFGAGLANWEGD
jgi:hypothetical protein